MRLLTKKNIEYQRKTKENQLMSDIDQGRLVVNDRNLHLLIIFTFNHNLINGPV